MTQVVLYTDDMEAITVIDLPLHFMQRLKDGITMRIPVEMSPQITSCHSPPSFEPPTIVEIWAERFVRKGRDTWFLFTKDDELALLLKSDVLPGQRKAFQGEFRRGFVSALIQAMR